MQTRKWQDKDGNDKYTTEIIASEFSFIGSKSGSNEDDFSNKEKSPDQTTKQKEDFNQDLPSQQDDEIPF